MSSDGKIKTVIMSLDNNYGTINFVPGSRSIASVELRSHTITSLSQLRSLGIDTVVLADQRVLGEVSSEYLRQFLPEGQEVIVVKDLRTTLSDLSKSKLDAKETVFVSADRDTRGIAAEFGFFAVSHPSIAAMRVTNPSLHFVRLQGDEEQLNHFSDIIPYYVDYPGCDKIMMLALMSHDGISKAIANKFMVDVLPLNISTEDPMYVSIDRFDDRTTEKLREQKILSFDGHRALIALGPSSRNDSVPFHDMHGHYLFLIPNLTLIKPASQPKNLIRKSELNLTRWPLKKVKLERVRKDIPTLLVDTEIQPVEAAFIETTIGRYSGSIALDSNGPIKSRHCEHPDNSRVISALIDDLSSMGYTTFTHTFQYHSETLNNVIADLPGVGYYTTEPNLPEQIRNVFLKHSTLYPAEPWIKEIESLTGTEWMKEQNLDTRNAYDLRTEIEHIFLRDSAWWVKDKPLNGLGSQMVIVCCHLDSTAGREPPDQYDTKTDPAPGADDNASGLAGVLAIAKYMSQFRGKLPHTIRFCFFNAEEVGLLGSKAYAPTMKDKDAAIKAVVNMDMLGYNSDSHRTFEIHAGFPKPSVRDLCVPIGELIKQWSDNLGRLGNAQIYKGTLQGGSHDFDRDKFDGAIARSDHFSFQEVGYPACHISEDFFANYPTESSDDPNPNYHRFTDNNVDVLYTTDIVTAAALAIKELASN